MGIAAGAHGMAVGRRPRGCDIVIGTRPEAIKLAPVIRALRDQPSEFRVRVVTSGQNRKICRSAMAAFGIAADIALYAKTIGSSLANPASELVRALGRHIAQSHPDLVPVQRNKTTTMVAALVGSCAQRNTEKDRLATSTA
jgi:UDP-N-acetylglucosamine 2-epimerase